MRSRPSLWRLALLAPGVAHAAQSSHDAQGFVGVTDTGRVVRFSDRTLPAISTPVAVSGLSGGDAIVALDRAPSGELLALGRSSAIYTLDPEPGARPRCWHRSPARSIRARR